MASREKRALAPSKSKQRANNDSSSLPAENSRSSQSSKKTKLTTSLQSPRQQLARDIFEAVATGSQLSAKLEAALPRKRALQTALKRKQKAKKTLIKVKQKVPIKTRKRIAELKKILKRKPARHQNSSLDNSTESDEARNKCKTAKKPKTPARANEEAEAESQDKHSPKLGKRLIDCSPKSGKGGKGAVLRRNESKERDAKAKRSLSKEPEELKTVIKTEPNDNSYELTIEEVIASSMLVEHEVDLENEESASESEYKGKRIVKNPLAKRSLRNGKLRQIIPKAEPDTEQKKTMSDAGVDAAESKAVRAPDSIECMDGVTVKVEVDEDADTVAAAANNHVNESATESIETNNNGCEGGVEADGRSAADMGPTLRSKTKARSSDSGSDIRSTDGAEEKPAAAAVKVEPPEPKKEQQSRPAAKPADATKAPAAAGNNALKGRRSSLNIDVRRSSLYGGDKAPADGGSKSEIDEMIDQIKLTIAKSIESKIYKQDAKGLLLGKGFEPPKVEEVFAPLSNDTVKQKLDDEADEEMPNVSKGKEAGAGIGQSLAKKEDTENSVPRVADTAKEIEKLVMGDIEPADSQPFKENSEQPSSAGELATDGATKKDEKKSLASKNEELGDKTCLQSTSSDKLDDSGKDSNAKPVEEAKKTSPPCPTRKSTRVTAGKSSFTSEMKKSISDQEVVSKETDRHNEETKTPTNEKNSNASDKTEEKDTKAMEKVTSKVSGKESKNVENKTVGATEIQIKEESIDAPETNTEIERMEVDGADKIEETLESLSRDVERLVQEDDTRHTNEKARAESEASSDAEARLTIDEDVPESAPTEKESSSQAQSNTSDNKEGCDQQGSTKSPDDVQKVEATAESASDVQDNADADVTTAKSVVIDQKSKEAVKAKSTEVEEVEEQKENRRVLRTRGDKQKKVETAKSVRVPTPNASDKSEAKVKSEDAATFEVPLSTTQDNTAETKTSNQNQTNETSESNEPAPVIKTEPEEQHEPQMRTRRSREVKKAPLPVVAKGKRGPKKQEVKKTEVQQNNKEETLLDNEVAKINENDRSSSFLKSDSSVRGVSADSGNTEQEKLDIPEAKSRSKSENDARSTNVSSDILKADTDSLPAGDVEGVDAEGKATSKDSDETSSSGESSSSVEKILETPEDRAKKEDILRQLGLESWERVKERKAKKEQQYTGTLKTVIRIQKEKDGKKRSRSPLKMVLKQQGRADGEESIDFYTIQKEIGSSGLGDTSSGANRKLSTNPRHSCDEDNDDTPLKDRQSLVIPEKSSSFSIHPGRLCADNCCYCHGKFGSLDTPMHLASMKSDVRRRKILENEVHLTKDSCLCDACYRHVDRKANMSPTNMQLKHPRQNRQSIMGCTARNCTESARHHVKRRWLVKIKPNIRNMIDINWDSTQHNLMTFCSTHYSKIERFLTCSLCKRRLTKNYTLPIGLSAEMTEDLNNRLQQCGIPAQMVPNTFVCRLCKYFMNLYVKNPDYESMTDSNKDFYKRYRKKLLYFHDIDEPDSEDEPKEKDRRASAGPSSSKKLKYTFAGIKLPSSKSPDNLEAPSTSTSEKSSPEPPKTDLGECETSAKEDAAPASNSESRCLGIEGAIEKLKKRKNLDTTSTSRSLLNSSNELANKANAKDVVEILAMDKEVTLTRLPKRPRLADTPSTSNDITPVVQRLGANPSISVRTLFPGEEEMNLHANVEFNNVREVTPQGWEKCATMIQYDRDTKMLWQELQRPYGNQSSFLRHLILLEKYYRSGDLILAPNASRNAINYSTSVQNRLISYEGPEKMDEILEPISAIEYNNSRRLSGGYVVEQRDTRSLAPSTSTSTSFANVTSQLSKLESSPREMKLTPGVSIIKKPPPNLQRLNTIGNASINGNTKRKDGLSQKGMPTGGKVFQLTEPELKRLQTLKKQKQMMSGRQAASSPNNGSGSSNSPPINYKMAQYQKAQLAAQSQFQKHLRMQQEMLNQRSRGDFEPLICDIRTSANENTPTQNLLNNLNLPKSIQVTTKAPSATSTPIPILPKIPKSLTVIPQTVARAQDK